MEKSCRKIPVWFLQFTKKAEKAIFWSRIHFFRKFVTFIGKLLSFRIPHLAKLVGTPSIRVVSYSKNDYLIFFRFGDIFQVWHLEFKIGRWNDSMYAQKSHNSRKQPLRKTHKTLNFVQPIFSFLKYSVLSNENTDYFFHLSQKKSFIVGPIKNFWWMFAQTGTTQ